jgi:glycosyltransferase involved in cell wall biosynthesis
MAFGTPVIGAAVGAIPELVNENTGVLALPGDVHALAVAMIDLLHDTTRLTGLGLAARKRVVARFNSDIARRVLGVCKQAAST